MQWQRIYRSFGHAFRGLSVLFRTQPNARVHLAALSVVVTAGVVAKLSRLEWIVLTLTSAAVLVTEALNTALEFLADAAVPQQHPMIGRCKDVAAGAVLLAAITAVVVGSILFGSRLF